MENMGGIGCLAVAAPSSSPLTRTVTPNNSVIGASSSPMIKQTSPKKKTQQRKYKKTNQDATVAAKYKRSSAETTWKQQEQQYCTEVSIMPETDVSQSTSSYTMAQTLSSTLSSSIMDYSNNPPLYNTFDFETPLQNDRNLMIDSPTAPCNTMCTSEILLGTFMPVQVNSHTTSVDKVLCGMYSNKFCQEVDISDIDIFNIYHSV